MVKQEGYYRSQLLISLGLLFLALFVWLALMKEFRLDDSFITYRYARNAARGLGLVYNAGDTVLSTTAPLYALLLAILSLVIPDFHFWGGLIGSLSIGLGGWLLVTILPPRLSIYVRLWAGVLYVLSTMLWLALGMETALWLVLVLASIRLTQLEKWWQAGLLIGLAILARPDAALPGLLLGLMALGATVNQFNTRRRWWLPLTGYGLAATVPVLIFGLWAWATYGSPLPVTLGAKNAQAVLGITGFGPSVTTWEALALVAQGLMSQSSLYITFGLLALYGLSSKISSYGVLIVGWSVLHLLAYMIFRVAPYRWYYAPLVPGIMVLMVFGLDYIHKRLEARKIIIARYIVAGIALFPVIAELTSFARIVDVFKHGGPSEIMLPIVDWEAYRQVGEWLSTQTPTDATVGVAEVGQVGFYAGRWMTDYLGLLQPEVSDMLEHGDLYSWLVGYAPDYLVFQRFHGAPLVLYNYLIEDDPWFRANYHEAAEFDDPRYSSGPVTIFERGTSDKTVLSQTARADFEGLHLTGLATDGYDLSTQGEPVRVRLDWQVTSALPADMHIAVKGLEMPEIPSFDGDYHTSNWEGSFSTWHGFVLPEALSPGGYPLQVSIGPTGGPYTSQNVGWLDVSFPKDEPAANGIIFSRGDEPQLRWSSIQVDFIENALILNTTWRAEQDIASDYSYFVHIIPANGGAPVAQTDGRPINGMYPTYLWQQGEIVPLQIELDGLPTTPGEDNIALGWYIAPDGPRLTQVNGTDQRVFAQIAVRSNGSIDIQVYDF